MASLTASIRNGKREIFDLSGTCEDLFLKYYADQLPFSETRARAELQHERFCLWASYLGVFASHDGSLDKRLEHSDEIQSLVVQLLELLRENLEFVTSKDKAPQQYSFDLPNPESKLQLQGTASEAMDAVEATISRLIKLGSNIRRYSTSSLDSRVRAFTETHGDENYTKLAKRVVHFKYRTASPSLQEQLAVSMSARRQRLRYIRRHHEKLASRPQGFQNKSGNWPARGSFSRVLQRIDEVGQGEILAGSSVGDVNPNKASFQQIKQNNALHNEPATSVTVASSFSPTKSVIARMQGGDGASVVSSSKQSTTIMAEDLSDYPEPPARESGKPEPACPFCCKPLHESELKVRNWRRHVNQDLKPFVCISEKCNQPPRAFESFEIWAKHMRDLHTAKWTQIIHKPIVWRCDVDHPKDEPFTCTEEDVFEEHLNSCHNHCSGATRRAISRTSRIARRRGPDDCPLCGYGVYAPEPSQPRSAPASLGPACLDVGNLDKVDKLARHIASHLRRLAFDSVKYLDAGTDENCSLESAQTSNWKELDGSNKRPPSGLKDLSQVSLRFDDTAILKLRTEAIEFDRDWSPVELARLHSSPDELSSMEIPDWPVVVAKLKINMRAELITKLEHEQESDPSDPILEHLYQQQLLRTIELSIARGAEFDSFMNQHEDYCFPGTRTDILQQISQWATSPQGNCIFWLQGMAGTGKSTVSRTVAKSLKETGLLGASFFFKRGEGDRGNAMKFFPTITRQLVVPIPQLIPAIQKALHDDPNIAVKSLEEQFDKLLLQPLLSLKSSNPHTPTTVIVIDALDECERAEDMRIILNLLPRLRNSNAVHVRVFLTSRPEFPILLGFSQITNREYEDLALHNIPERVMEQDISMFLKHRLSAIRKDRSLPVGWPGDTLIHNLVRLSVPSFTFAATACRMIEDPEMDPVESLTEILTHQSDGSRLTGTYLPVLSRLLKGRSKEQENKLVREFQNIIGAILVLESPLSIPSLSRLIDLPEELVSLRLSSLHSVFSVPEDHSLPVRLFHLSFRDFILDPETRDKTPFWVDEKKTQQRLTTRCLFMCDGLRKNICGLPSDGIRRTEIDSLTIDRCLPPELQYACRYWASHLVQCADLNDTIHGSLLFLQRHFLHWVEAMSLVGLVSELVGILDSLQAAISGPTNSSMSDFLHDAKRFILKNRQIADEAPLQLYCSGLVFTPQTTIIRSEFIRELPAWIRLLPQVDESWSAELQTLEGHSSSVQSVAFSPDGRLLASGSHDLTLRLWDPTTGALQQTLEGHSSSIQSVAFSPDSWLLASGSHDNTLRLWDPTTGALQQTLKGHSGSVQSVAFSPDGRLLASGSHDNTVRLWDPIIGALQQTLKGHSSSVQSVAFSTDGRLLASSSHDKTVRLWDTATGARQRTLEGHSGSVQSVAFSPNGRVLASGSQDKTVRLWDTATGALQQTLKGYSSSVQSVAFSPDGRILASGSGDNTVRLWDTATGAPQQTFERHSSSVQSVAFSPNGRVLASGSQDKTVRLWDPTTGALEQTLERHSSSVQSVAFSPDGRVLASGSQDKTVRLWDPITGTLQQTLEGHSNSVQSLAFSPDGRLLASGSHDNTLRLWDTATGALQQTLKGYSSSVQSVAFSPDGRVLASSSRDNTVQLWDPTTGALQQTLGGHSSSVQSVTFSPDGRLLASGSDDDTVRLWDATTGDLQHTWSVGGIATLLEFSLDGSYLRTNLGSLDIQSRFDTGSPHVDLEIFIEQGQWITLNGGRVIWLPPESRPICSAIHGSVVALGHASGRISFIGFRV